MSKIEVNKIGPQCGTTLTVGCGAGQTVAVDANTVTLGRCGGTVALASGASQTGFGRTGTVDWQTSDIKTSTFTAVNGQGFFVDTNGGAVTSNLPAGSAGAIVSFQDYRNTFDTNPLTVTPNGSEKINGGSAGGSLILDAEGEGLTLVYIDSTIGWRSIQDSQFSDVGANFISATGGTVTCSGDYKIHTFTGPGTFCVSNAGTPVNAKVSYLVIAGGGGGGASNPGDGSGGGGGGAGGYREGKNPADPGAPAASPLAAACSALPVSAQAYPITVGAGGSGVSAPPEPNQGLNGNPSVFSTITSTAGGGGGGGANPTSPTGKSGGSGGGAGNASGSGTAGSGNTPPVTPPQGNNGGGISPPGTTPNYGSGGGGGAGGTGTNGTNLNGGPGGNGITTSINASPVIRAGGGGGGVYAGGVPFAGNGGPGGGGNGGGGSSRAATSGTTNTGSGGGGLSFSACTSGNGGSGLVIIRYKFQ